ncbi:MAG: dihydropyrimidinase [Candidatus Dormibacteria bacterium]
MDLVINGGTVVGVDGTFIGDVGISDGKIVAVTAPGLLETGQRRIDAEGLYVLPGGVDPHAHTALKSGGTKTLDDFFESTRAAAFGGTTTIIDFAIPDNSTKQTPQAALDERRRDIKGRAAIDVSLHACITRGDAASMGELPVLLKSGLPTLKMFTIYRNDFMLELAEVHACLQEVARAGGMALVHCESPHIVEPLVDSFVRQGSIQVEYHARSRPPSAEVDMVRSIIELLRITGAMGYVVHVSTPEAALAIAKARGEGVKVWAETCPQYVFLDDSSYQGVNSERFVCSPPLRDEARRAHLWELLLSGHFAIWGSDHCCYSSAQKAAGMGDFRRIPNGLPGVETRCPLLYSAGVATGLLSVADFVRLTATNPARLAGLFPQKGIIAPGSDADLALYDPTFSATLSTGQLHMATDYTPFEGTEIRGWPVTVISRGELVVDRGEFVGAPGRGRFVPGATPQPPFGASGRRASRSPNEEVTSATGRDPRR